MSVNKDHFYNFVEMLYYQVWCHLFHWPIFLSRSDEVETKQEDNNETGETSANVKEEDIAMADLVQKTVITEVGTVNPEANFKELLARGEPFDKGKVLTVLNIPDCKTHHFIGTFPVSTCRGGIR